MDTVKMEFPPMESEQRAKVDNLLQNIEDLMDVKFKSTQIVITQLEIPADRVDVIQTVRRVINTLKKQAVKLKEKM